jgi:hypothetical protein
VVTLIATSSLVENNKMNARVEASHLSRLLGALELAISLISPTHPPLYNVQVINLIPEKVE